jgi:peptidoglycan L-alanyl-D-glutamate endopeptidase CwlK
MDQVTLDRIELLHPLLRDEAKEIYKEICERLTGNVICRFSHTLRTFKEQDELYAQGRTKPGKVVTDARGGQSYHNYGLAIDIVFLIDKDGNGSCESPSWDIDKDVDRDGVSEWKEVDFVFNLYGWNGLYKPNGQRYDFPHFQKTLGLTIQNLKKLPVVNGYPVLKSL